MPDPCVKVCYPSRKAAKKALKELNRHRGMGLTDAYFCEACQHWHLTSRPKEQGRNYRRHLVNINKVTTKLFFDFEFTGLHQHTTPISLGIWSDCGHTFYAEFNDYDRTQVTPWLQDHVISQLIGGNDPSQKLSSSVKSSRLVGTREEIRTSLEQWLKQFEKVQMWGDCLAWDWVLFCQIFGHAFKIPANVLYIPMDICVLILEAGIDPDISRSKLGRPQPIKGIGGHHALWDAYVIKCCYDKLKK